MIVSTITRVSPRESKGPNMSPGVKWNGNLNPLLSEVKR